MTYALYYAGMAGDLVTEQIGLAVSEDGLDFTRVGDGLLVPTSPAHPWKALRTCNPTVVARPGGGYAMFYQGISQLQETCIAAGWSDDGLSWQFDDEPLLSVSTLGEELEAKARGLFGLIEPSVLVDSDGFRMWFVSRGANEPGNRLHHARSTDGRTWRLDGAGLVTGGDFGAGRMIHYPQVSVHGNGFILDVSLKARDGSFTVIRGFSADGLTFGDWREEVPRAFRRGLCHRIRRRLFRDAKRFALGLAHSHVVPGETATYYHAYHLNRRGRIWMDVVRRDASAPDVARTVFSPAEAADAWDSFFVADPYIIRLG
ncbi:hypothetical protein [Oleispirillum naphthae]|uniref:hypothetical protein n=1 Tax=Oleispirillum naphthae TaxID=2838853 RepID=UPI00308256A1